MFPLTHPGALRAPRRGARQSVLGGYVACSSMTSCQTTQRNRRKTSSWTKHHHWTDIGGGQIQTKSSKAGDRAEYPYVWGAKTLHIAGSVREDPGKGQASRRQIFLQREQQNGNRVQAAGGDGELIGAVTVLICALAMEPQTLDFLVTNRGCVDDGKRRIRGITR